MVDALNKTWSNIRPKRYQRDRATTSRDMIGAGAAGLSSITIAQTIQWVVDVAVPGGVHLPHQPALVLATLIGVWYARTYQH